MKPKLVITHKVHDEVLEMLAPHCDVITNQTTCSLSRHDTIQLAADADALMVFMPDRVDADFLKACPKLKVIGAALKGYDNFDVEACTANNVWLTFVPDLLTVPTAELTIGLMVGLIRHIRASDEHVRSGYFKGWRPQFYGLGVEGSTIAIIGMGAIGQAIAQRLSGWDAKLIYTDQQPLSAKKQAALNLEFVSLDEALAQADIVIMALPLNAQTQHLVNEPRLKQMQSGAFLVNPCRGSVVDEAAVLRMLSKGHLAGYASDVFEMEDWARADRPGEIDQELLTHPKTLFTSHIGSAVSKVRLAIEQRAAENILSVLRGEQPLDPANQLSDKKEMSCST
ncbi:MULTISPECIES: phosphonate dehydrogenase [unclassified Methylophaga]|jgi:phosphonate dehydrogenase|uniref:phosphonate dehydrogenase n=1 Tax=unclassified Methylophaga TaxID=2629249 RepID=UPI000C50CBAF|nr:MULTISPECIES: phosphonate dehydrogenase [unclassified Methylophaga]MAL50340.1 hydroxyacid dehydrogenase [Methylophaga sp.]MBP25689.1 hydroxyacid dehydrogenase [Methylophaga sp.]HCC81505.1 hydroxyacid dehydrogenase [Methylophaga sp.]|tara:strand:- start:7935 stop:8951 length:1017 start_codon:yes stop_codon:yes gene_type:complete